MMRAAIGIVGGFGALVLTGLAASYGYATAPDPVAGAVVAFFYAFVAVVGMAGPAGVVHLAVHLPGWAKLGTIPVAVVVLAAMFGNLTNSLGALVSRSDAQSAVRLRVADAGKDAKVELARITTERKALKFTPADDAAVATASVAVKTAARARAAECGNGDLKQRGKNCRDREADEKTATDRLTAIVADRAATEQAARLDREAAGVRAKIASAPPVGAVNPLGEALERMLSIPAADATTWQQGFLVFVAELAVACLLAAWEGLRAVGGERSAARPEDEVSGHCEPKASATAGNVVTLTPGDVGKFATASLMPAPGQSVAATDLHEPYRQWCADQGCRALGPEEFAAQFAQLCEFAGVRKRMVRGRVLCLDLALSA